MEQIEEIHCLIQTLSEDKCIVVPESFPSSSERAQDNDRRLQLYKTAIFSLLTEFEVVKSILEYDSLAPFIDRGQLEIQAAQALEDDDDQIEEQIAVENTNNELLNQTSAYVLDTVDNWQASQKMREELIVECREILETHSQKVGETEETDDWLAVSELMRQQRDKLQDSVKVLEDEASRIHKNEISVALQNIEDRLRQCKQTHESVMDLENDIERWESILVESHGIDARQVAEDDNENILQPLDYTSFLREEIALIANHYVSEADSSRDIFEIQIGDAGEETVEMAVTPRRDWLRELRKGEAVPILKEIIVTYGRSNPLPLDIKLKVDLSLIPAKKLEEVQGLVATTIGNWKSKALTSATLDLHSLFTIFLTVFK